MANKSEYKTRRDLLYKDNAPAEQISRYAASCIEEGHLSDAVDLFEKAADTEGLEQLKKHAVEEGDFFIFNRVLKILGQSGGIEDYKQLADNAARLGKAIYAEQARRAAGMESSPA